MQEKNLSRIKGFGQRQIWLPAGILLLMYALALTSLGHLAPTFDEQGFITRGLAYVRGENQSLRVGHPLGLNALNAALLASDDAVRLPTDDPSWLLTSFHRPSELFLWEMGNDVAHVMFLARLPTIWLGLLLTAVTGRWAWDLTRKRWAGWLAMALLAFDPNILAHTRLATTDLGLAAFAFLAGYGLWRFWQRPSPLRATFAGITFGLLQNTKFTAGLFIPLFALVILVNLGVRLVDYSKNRSSAANPQSMPPNPLWLLLMLAAAYVLIAPLTLWAAYGFQIGTLPPDLPMLPQLSGFTVPLSHHLEQLLDIGGRMQQATPAFLHGRYSDSGWWYYFPVAFVLKTPLPTLILLVWAVIWRVRRYVTPGREGAAAQRGESSGRRTMLLDDAALLVPALGYFAIALTTDINLGYRHILPTLPFLVVFMATAVSAIHLSPATTYKWALGGLMGWLVLIALWIHPHYLAYFNVLAGGPSGGWRYLVDSNLDWGQDLADLKVWMTDHDVDQVWLSYFGEARPSYYGINYIGLDSWPPRLMDPDARPFYPPDPAPGIYAISATNLQGVHFADHDEFAWFRAQTPVAKIGYSIFIYDVKENGDMVDVSLGGLQIDELDPADFARFQSNRVVLHWFDPAQAVLLPESDNRWVVLPAQPTLPDEWGYTADWELAAQTAVYRLYRLPPMDDGRKRPRVEFAAAGGTIGLLNWVVGETAVPGQTLTVTTHWFKTSSPEPVKIFLHLTDEAGNIVAQWDGLGAKWQGWRPQSLLRQTHAIPLPADLPPGRYEVRLGLYNPENGRRLPTTAGQDSIVLGDVLIESAP